MIYDSRDTIHDTRDMAEKPVKVGLVGFGTVGCGVAKLITEDAD